jgi:hypothetical protein
MKRVNMAKYLECVVPTRDLLAFVCEDPEDSNFLMEELRDKLRYKVNVVTSKPNLSMTSFTRPHELQSVAWVSFYFQDVLWKSDDPLCMAYYIELLSFVHHLFSWCVDGKTSMLCVVQVVYDLKHFSSSYRLLGFFRYFYADCSIEVFLWNGAFFVI